MLVVLSILAVLAVVLMQPDKEKERARRDNETMIALCQKVWLDRSQTPSTATFLSATVTPVDYYWTVSGQVDAQNLFGAMVRTTYLCEMYYDESTHLFGAHIPD